MNINIDLDCNHCDCAEMGCPRKDIYLKSAANIKEALKWLGVMEREDLSIELKCAKIQDNTPLSLPSFLVN